jgi:glycyl-tRNA synthetase beta chain
VLQSANIRVGLYKAAVFALNSLVVHRPEQGELAKLLKSYDDVQLSGAGVERLISNFDWARDAAKKTGSSFFEYVADSVATEAIASDVFQFTIDRLKVQLRDQGKRHDLVEAALREGAQLDDDLVRIVARVEALDAFLKTEAGANLLAGYKRAANILAAEEKKGKGLSDADVNAGLDAKLLKEAAEQALFAALEKALPAARAAVEKEDFAAAMQALADLRAPVDAFFDKVMVNADDAALRRNRLLLLARLVEATSAVADFSKIEG